MELRHLRYFVTVAEELHFGRAAEKLFISQPPLSQQIQQLEREIGALLFRRTNRRVELTAAGAAFLEDARQILVSVETAVLTARRTEKGEIGWVGVGFSASATYDLLPDVLHHFRDRYPEVDLSLYELTAAEQTIALREKTIHIGFARPYVQVTLVHVEAVLRESLIAALPESHPLAAIPTLHLAQLACEAFIGFPPLPKPSYADIIRAACEEAGFAPRIAQEVREMQTAISLVAAGIGIALVPESVQNLRRSGVTYRAFAPPSPTTELMVVRRVDDSSPAVDAFLEIVRERMLIREAGGPVL